MPLKIAGKAIRMTDPSRLDMNTAIVVFISATHRYRPVSEERGPPSAAACPADCSSLAQPWVVRLLH
jgi:hypothetical protein